ncbi:MAG: hypothetical protein RBT41_01160 [Clostridia bacterium]|jgi:predicted small lipoprotein YifL|nr:hypothetical protein [Clostridia bacterium]
MKKVLSTVFLLLMLIISVAGCNSEKITNPETMQKMVDEAIATTQEIIAKKDLKTARSIWGQISEFGVKAEEIDEKELAEAVGKLASTYVYLLEYLEKGDEQQLKIFNEKFDRAVSVLKQHIENYEEK